MGKTLVLFKNKNIYYFDNLALPNIDIRSVFEDDTGSKHLGCKIARKLDSSLTRFYYEKWYKNLDQYEKIIVMDVMLSYDIKLLRNIAVKAPNAKKYVYSWNIVKNDELYKRLRNEVEKNRFEIFCYDHHNCKKYNMKFNTIMYDRFLRIPKSDISCDSIFLGYMKDRKENMLSLYNIMITLGIKPRFIVVCEPKDNRLPCFEYSEQYIDYYDYLEMIAASRSLLDITQNGQDGYSMRVMEAIYFDKKLITTNSYIRNAEFYDPNNILIIDLNNLDTHSIQSFFDKEFHPYSESIKEYYSFEKWVERFE